MINETRAFLAPAFPTTIEDWDTYSKLEQHIGLEGLDSVTAIAQLIQQARDHPESRLEWLLPSAHLRLCSTFPPSDVLNSSISEDLKVAYISGRAEILRRYVEALIHLRDIKNMCSHTECSEFFHRYIDIRCQDPNTGTLQDMWIESRAYWDILRLANEYPRTHGSPCSTCAMTAGAAITGIRAKIWSQLPQIFKVAQNWTKLLKLPGSSVLEVCVRRRFPSLSLTHCSGVDDRRPSGSAALEQRKLLDAANNENSIQTNVRNSLSNFSMAPYDEDFPPLPNGPAARVSMASQKSKSLKRKGQK
jgi:hypothetical protein